MKAQKRKIIVQDSSSGEEEEEGNHSIDEEIANAQPLRRSLRAAKASSKSTSSVIKSGLELCKEMQKEEEEGLWKEETELERNNRLFFVVDDDGAGYLDDDVDHKGKEYEQLRSEGEEEDDDDQADRHHEEETNKRAVALRKKRVSNKQQDLFQMFTKVQRNPVLASEEESPMKMLKQEKESADAGFTQDDEEDLFAQLLQGSSSKPAKGTTHKVSRSQTTTVSTIKHPRRSAAPTTSKKYSPPSQTTTNKFLEEDFQPTEAPVFDSPQQDKYLPSQLEESVEPVLPTPPSIAEAEVELPQPPVELSSKAKRALLLAKAAAAPLPLAKYPVQEEEPLPALPMGTFLPAPASTLVADESSLSMNQSCPFPLVTNEDSEGIEFFWTDMYEASQGEVFMFGKTVAAAESNTAASVCVCVKNISRSLLVYPRSLGQDGALTLENKKQVQEEVLDAIRTHRLDPSHSTGGGVRFKTKWVSKLYAFELPDIPRGQPVEFLLVEYSMALERSQLPPTFPSGRLYQNVFGANQTAIERFLLSYKVMGPCWFRMEKGDIVREKQGMSHCKFEAVVDMLKSSVSIIPNRPPPPVSVLSLSLKTFVDPTTHQHQIVLATGVFHSRIPLDGAEVLKEDAAQVKFQLLRPITLGDSLSERLRGVKFLHPNVLFQPNERALLSCLLALIHQLDPDMLCGHNIEGFELDLLLTRLKVHNLKQWSKLGRLNLSKFPYATSKQGRQSHVGVRTPGRLIVDTYTSAQEFLLGQREYSLSSLCEGLKILRSRRADVEPSQVPTLFTSGPGIVHLLNHTVETSMLQLKLAFKLEVFTLSLELTCVAGNLWRRTLGSGRAERIEYLLSHAFYNQDFVLPDKDTVSQKKKGKGASYAGGLVLEPKPGVYDSYIVLLDFNALYPSIIQEFNICFTTVKRPAVVSAIEEREESKKSLSNKKVKVEEEEEEEGEHDAHAMDDAPESAAAPDEVEVPLPVDDGRGPNGLAILPRVIQNIVDRRRQVQQQLAHESDPLKRSQLDTRQKALKITANSMYGCLGFSSSRYFARPLASLITSQGRAILMDTVETTEKLGFKVVYGDTDSIMIDTQIRNTEEPGQVLKIAEEIQRGVNPKYKFVKIALDGIFKTLLLLKKKKYASLKLILNKLPQVEVKRETKGLDQVRRDWCPASQRLGSEVLNLILSSKPDMLDEIRALLVDFKERLPSLDLREFTITKGLNKSPKDYPDQGKNTPHLQVALNMLERKRTVNVGDHIPYVICTQTRASLKKQDDPDGPILLPSGPNTIAQRAFHPDEVAEFNLQIDLPWYLSTQLFPPIQRLLEVIPGISSGEVAQCLGLDASKFQTGGGTSFSSSSISPEDAIGAHFDSVFGNTLQQDLDRFALCDRVELTCSKCSLVFPFAGVCTVPDMNSGLNCPQCHEEAVDIFVLQNLLTLSARKQIQRYYQNIHISHSDLVEPGFKTRQIGLRDVLPYQNRRIHLEREMSSKDLWIQLLFLVTLVDVSRFEIMIQRENDLRKHKGQDPLRLNISTDLRKELTEVKDYLEKNFLHNSAYGWVDKNFFAETFKITKQL